MQPGASVFLRRLYGTYVSDNSSTKYFNFHHMNLQNGTWCICALKDVDIYSVLVNACKHYQFRTEMPNHYIKTQNWFSSMRNNSISVKRVLILEATCFALCPASENKYLHIVTEAATTETIYFRWWNCPNHGLKHSPGYLGH